MTGHISYPRTAAEANAESDYEQAITLANGGEADRAKVLLRDIIDNPNASPWLKRLAEELLTKLNLEAMPRTQDEFHDMASDPAHGGKISPKSVHERTVAMDLEGRGDVPGPIKRDPTGAADFVDGNGQKWDVKGFNSNFPPTKGGFDPIVDGDKVDESLGAGEHVMLDTSKMSPSDVAALKQEGVVRGWGERVKWWP